MYQLLMLAMNVALVSNNIGLMWVAIEVATLTTVLMVGMYRTSAALEAAWKYFILGSVGIALALFGTILVYLAAQQHLGRGHCRRWPGSQLVAASDRFDPALLNLAFVFLILGYGTKVGLAPDACLAAGRARRGSDADFGGALGAAAERGVVCAAALQADHGRAIRRSSRRVR